MDNINKKEQNQSNSNAFNKKSKQTQIKNHNPKSYNNENHTNSKNENLKIKKDNENELLNKNNAKNKHVNDKKKHNHNAVFEIIGVKLDRNSETFYYNANGECFEKNDYIICENDGAIEYGKVSFGNFVIKPENFQFKIYNFIRKANQEDLKKINALIEKAKIAQNECQKLAKKYNLEMKLVDVKILFDETKIIFSFTSEGRVDFRELVKDLASKYYTRIEMKQIGVRDETRCIGCYGRCGQECCCTRFLPNYEKVSVKMAKNQNLSLNPQKISGVCGRLLCCLGYENEHYIETLKQMPKVGSKIDTPDGEGIVTYNNLLSKFVSAKVKVDDEHIELRQYNLSDIKIYEKNIINDKNSKEDDNEND